MPPKTKAASASYAQHRRNNTKAATDALRAVIPDDFFQEATQNTSSTDHTPETKTMIAAKLYIEAAQDTNNSYAANFPSHLTNDQSYKCALQVFRRITHIWAYEAKDSGDTSQALKRQIDMFNDVLVEIHDSISQRDRLLEDPPREKKRKRDLND